MKTITLILIAASSFGAIPKLQMYQYPSANTVSFETDIKPLFKSKCTKCHNENNKTPDVTKYEVAYGLRNEIRTRVVESKSMPLYGELTESERSKVKYWLDGGAQK